MALKYALIQAVGLYIFSIFKLITLNNNLLRILQYKSYKFPFAYSSVVNICSQYFYTVNTYCLLPLPTISSWTVQFIYIIRECEKICIWILFLQI